MLDCTDDTVEIVVVDGGSTDGTTSVLHRLSESSSRLRWVSTRGESTGLAADRNRAVRLAAADHVLVQLDADDEYHTIMPYCRLYESLREHRSRDFFLSASGINIAPKSLLLRKGPYREGLPRAEDVDLWRRLAVTDELVWIDNDPPMTILRDERTKLQRIDVRADELVGEIMSGVSLSGVLSSIREENATRESVLSLLALPIAVARWRGRCRYVMPERWPYDRPGFPRSEQTQRTVSIDEDLRLTK
jgi:hypothetical protein